MEGEFRVETFVSDGAALGVRIHGELDTATAESLLQTFEAWPESTGSCVVDLANCDFLDSSGIRALLLCHRRLDGGKGTLRLLNVRPHIERVLRIAGVQEVIQIEA
jgi:anti-anti-sigma factor